ncbi:MAG TPA: toxin [Epsilonproteobacteria bacterium]|nr:toxin [Campylobacterota bacterium]
MIRDKFVRFSYEKNEWLKKERSISFEDVILSIEEGNLLDDLEHPNKEKYPDQNIFIILVRIKSYVYYVPYLEDETTIFLKTIVPSRKLNKKYNAGETNEQS